MKELTKEIVLERLKKAATEYYNNKESLMTDEEYDKLIEYAENNGWIKQNNKVNDLGTVNKTTIEHAVPMLSLNKAKTKEEVEEYFNYIRSYDSQTNFIVEPKLDGLALSVLYKDNVPYLAKTRGNGQQGEDVTYLLNSNELTIENLPKYLEDNSITEIRGEIIITKTNFNKLNGLFKHERGAVAGIVRKAKLGLNYNVTLSFFPYFAYSNTNQVEFPKTLITSENLFNDNISNDFHSLWGIVELAKEWRNELDYPTDGIVIKPTRLLKDIPSTEHHPKQYIAFKYPGLSKTTKLNSVTWQIGRTGVFTPVANIEPVTIDNVEISNVTLHNINWINEKNIKIGSIVEVVRGNDVIPVIKQVIFNSENAKEITPPTYCPYCSHKTEESKCFNFNCNGIVKQRINYIIGKNVLNIEGMSSSLVNSLVLFNVADIMDLSLKELENISYENGVSLGKVRAKQIYNNIQYIKTNTPDYIWLMTLDYNSLGKRTSQLLLSYFKSIDNFFNATIDELKSIKGIGGKIAEQLYNHNQYAKSLWKSLITDCQVTPINTIHKMASNSKGSFAVTGKVISNFSNRNEFVEYMENKNFTYHSSLKKDTDYLITDTPESNSSKNAKARKLGVKIVSFREALEF